MANQRKVFIVWDTQITGLGTNLEQLKSPEPEGFRIVVPAAGPSQGEIARDIVLKGIDEADLVVAFVDLPNANVGFEIGYALGKGKPVKLARRSEALPAWVEIPPLQNYIVERVTNAAAIRDLIRSNKQVVLEGAIEKGPGTAIACPHEDVGADVIERLRSLKPDWIHPPQQGWTLKDLSVRLGGTGRIVWTIVEHDGPRDGKLNAAAAVIAGYALGQGCEFHIWRHAKTRALGDVGHRERTWQSLDALAKLVAEIDVPAPPTGDALDTYFAFLRSYHSVLVSFFSGMADKTLGEVYVELAIHSVTHGPERTAKADPWSGKRLTLRDMLTLPIDAEAGVSGRWLVIGHPGAGKSTACRYLCFKAIEDADRPVPVYVSLARYARENRHPFLMAEEDVCATEAGKHVTDLARRLKQLAETTDRVWLLFDGFDEIPRERIDDVLPKLKQLCSDLERCKVVVTTRPEARPELGKGFVCAEIQKLEHDDRRKLLEKWLGSDADALLAHIAKRPTLLALAENPLMLTNLARLSLEPGGLPLRRVEVYQRTIELLLSKGYGKNPTPVKNPLAAQQILGELALRLFERGVDSWTEEEVQDTLLAFCNSAKEPWMARLEQWPGRAKGFLDDVSRNSGVLSRKGGPRDLWGFPHRSFGELLAAQALLGRGEAEYLARAAKLYDPQQDDQPRRATKSVTVETRYSIGEWGETFALLGALVRQPEQRRKLLERFHGAGASILVRTLPQVEGLDPKEVLEFLLGIEDDDWDGNDLMRFVTQWRAELRSDSEIRAALWGCIAKCAASTVRLAYLYLALEDFGPGIDRHAFFRECKRPVRAGDWPRFVPIAAGSFQMGSAKGQGYDHERPRHTVTLRSFELASTAVTRAQYREFDPEHEFTGMKAVSKGDEGSLPATDVSWWEAYLCCAWLGARLPSEAEWEYTCRAGTTTNYWTGDSEEDLAKVGWYDGNSDNRVHAVGEKPPNSWGLFDMHGNVWQWCEDTRHSNYEDAPSDGSAWVDEASEDRVLRGGSFGVSARGARSACRSGIFPSYRWHDVGFRPARSRHDGMTSPPHPS